MDKPRDIVQIAASSDAAGLRTSPGAVHHDHVVQFYESDDFLCDAVTRFLTEGLRAGEPAVVIATPDHRHAFSDALVKHGLDVDAACRRGTVTFLDAREALASFMTGSVPDEQRFRSGIGDVLKRSLGSGRAPRLRAYGEMVDVLWRDGNPTGAIRLEELWNDLARTHAFSLLCAYAMGNFYSEAHQRDFDRICMQHGRVRPAESYRPQGQEEDARLREICRLQQRASALEAEVEHRKALELALRQALADRRRTEAALRQAKEEAERASQAKSDFLAIMSHELRTPLNAIMGYEDLLQQQIGGPVNDTQRTYLGRIRAGARQLLGLIDQVLSMARIESGREELHTEPVDLAAIAAEAAAMVEPSAAEKGLAFTLVTPEREVLSYTDPGKLRQILLNLLSNAVKFTRAGRVELRMQRNDGWVAFEVEDTGDGIARGDLDKIFEPFVQIDGSATRSHGGIGLGLAVSRDLARLLGGEITVESARGSGTTFTLRLPSA